VIIPSKPPRAVERHVKATMFKKEKEKEKGLPNSNRECLSQ
jgi:hypothetical protein